MEAYSSPGRPHAVEHVCAEGDRHHQVFRIANAHDIARLLLRQQPSARVDDLAVVTLCLSTREPTNGNAWCVPGDHLSGALPPQIQIQPALYDAEEVLALRVLVGLYAAVEPAHRALHGLLHPGEVGRGSDDHVVELHHDVGADRVLQRHGVFGGEQHGRAIVRAEEADAFFGDFGELEQRHHLKAVARVSYVACVDEERGITHPPLSAPVSMLLLFRGVQYLVETSMWASTCENVMRP